MLEGCWPRGSRVVVQGEGLGLFAFSSCWLIGWDAFFFFGFDL